MVAGEKLLMRDVRSNSTVGQTTSFHGGDERGAERGSAGTSGQRPDTPVPAVRPASVLVPPWPWLRVLVISLTAFVCSFYRFSRPERSGRNG